jgi:hypothetical protein
VQDVIEGLVDLLERLGLAEEPGTTGDFHDVALKRGEGVGTLSMLSG